MTNREKLNSVILRLEVAQLALDNPFLDEKTISLVKQEIKQLEDWLNKVGELVETIGPPMTSYEIFLFMKEHNPDLTEYDWEETKQRTKEILDNPDLLDE